MNDSDYVNIGDIPKNLEDFNNKVLTKFGAYTSAEDKEPNKFRVCHKKGDSKGCCGLVAYDNDGNRHEILEAKNTEQLVLLLYDKRKYIYKGKEYNNLLELLEPWKPPYNINFEKFNSTDIDNETAKIHLDSIYEFLDNTKRTRTVKK